jgi:hypothetical protein
MWVNIQNPKCYEEVGGLTGLPRERHADVPLLL